MSKIFTALEQSINDANWQGVCDVYFKLTGKKIEPPVIKNIKPPTKNELYKLVKEIIPDLGPMKSFTIEDLQILYDAHKKEYEPELPMPTLTATVSKAPQKNEHMFIARPDRLLNVDKAKFNPRLTDFDSYDDEGDSKVERNRKDDRIKAVCKKCNKTVLVNPILATGTNNNGERTCICGNCSQ